MSSNFSAVTFERQKMLIKENISDRFQCVKASLTFERQKRQIGNKNYNRDTRFYAVCRTPVRSNTKKAIKLLQKSFF